jgi:hypothetical protein
MSTGIIAEVRLNGKPHKPSQAIQLHGAMGYSKDLHKVDSLDESGIQIKLHDNRNKISEDTGALAFARLALAWQDQIMQS